MEKVKESFHIAVASLASNPVRSTLSILGVVIGIGSVIAILGIGAGAKKQILQQFSAMGGSIYNLTTNYDEASMRMGEFELQDIERLERVPFVEAAVPQLNLYKPVRSRSTEQRGMILGITESYLVTNNITITKGRNLSPIEMEGRKPFCVISEDTDQALFPDSTAIGQIIYLENYPWQVVGVYSKYGSKKFKSTRLDIEILAPLSGIIRNFKDVKINGIEIRVKPNANENVGAELLKVMTRDDAQRAKLFAIRDQKDYLTRILEMQKLFSLIGIIVAGISLLVGGIGMMNVMLTSVAERTREIGLRRAVGARRKDVLLQFLVESCVLSGMGGFLGLIFGAAVVRILPLIFESFFSAKPVMQSGFAVIAVGIGVLLGATFGFYPAVKASKLSPAEALRSE